ncbi:MAG: CDP-diacylglycerol--glycerol-3-phosphate 3-phosphatidyltransferase [Bacteroidota bacterium]
MIAFPNQLTILRILLTPVFVAFLFSPDAMSKQLALVVFIAAALTDWYDGWVARRFGYASRLGKFLDPLADKILASAALIAFVYLNLAEAWMVWIIVGRDIVVTAFRAYAEWKNKPIITTFSAKVKTFSQMVLIFYILILYTLRHTPLAWKNSQGLIETLMHKAVLDGLMLLITLFTLWTGVTYVIENRKMIRELYVNFGRTAEPR